MAIYDNRANLKVVEVMPLAKETLAFTRYRAAVAPVKIQSCRAYSFVVAGKRRKTMMSRDGYRAIGV
eukprot:2070823-Prorocentrum_lima.AAC.1